MSPSNVTRAVALRLALASGNRCAFPGCGSLLWYEDPQLLLGEVCHIKGDKPGAKRFDPAQTDEERHGLDNLVFLCRNHHAEVDNDQETYTSAKLQTMKRDHEAGVVPSSPPPEYVVHQLVGTTDSYNVTSIGQQGGQTAWSIVNEGPQPRRITRAAGNSLITELGRQSSEHFQISSMSDAESGELAEVLQELLEQAGWQMDMLVQGAMLNRMPRGVIVETQVDSGGVSALINWLEAAGLNPQVNRGQQKFGILTMDSTPPIHIVVGVLP